MGAPLPLQVRCCFQAATRSDLAFSSSESHSYSPASAAEGEGSTTAGSSMGEDVSSSPSAIREDNTATAGLPPRLPSPSLVVDEVIEGPSTRSLSTEHIEHRPPHVNLVERTTVGHTPSRDVEAPSSPPPVPALNDFAPIDMLLPLDSSVVLSEHASFSLESISQMLAPAARGPSRSRDPSAAVEGEESALGQERGKDEPHDDEIPTRLLPPQAMVDAVNAGLSRTSSQSSFDTGKYSSLPHNQHDIV